MLPAGTGRRLAIAPRIRRPGAPARPGSDGSGGGRRRGP